MAKKLDIDKCIMIHDLQQIKKEPPKPKIKTKNKLSIILSKNKGLEGTKVSIYSKLVRYERDGFKKPDDALIDAILSTLDVSMDDLVVEL